MSQSRGDKSLTRVFVAAHSGGHIFPALELARRWRDESNNRKTVFITAGQAFVRLIPEIPPWIDKLFFLPQFRLPGKNPFRVIPFLLSGAFAALRSLLLFLFDRPEAVVTTGGVVAVPVCIVAWVLRIPVELWELNAVPGKAVRFLLPFASRVFFVFKKAKPKLSARAYCALELADYPVRFSEVSRSRDEIIAEFNETFCRSFSSDSKTVFVLGGSQGSCGLNKIFCNAVEKTKLDMQVVHQVGWQDQHDWKGFYESIDVPAL
ncbi:hypothetical protein HOD08_00740, partial [bacterium]|nr:hypothetical protein [bacterium]